MLRLRNKQIAVEPIFDSDYFNASTQLIKIPEVGKERCDQGVVKYMGANCDPNIKIGSHVIFSGYTGTTLGVDGEILIIMHSNFIKAIVDVDNYVVPGLYFKSVVKDNFLQIDIEGTLLGFKTGKIDLDTAIAFIHKHIARYEEKKFIPATYETSITFIKDATAALLGTRLDIKKEVYREQRDEFIDERSDD